jgi:hypothetical protein
MVLDRGSIEGEDEDEGWDCRALQQILEDVAFTPAPPSSSVSSISSSSSAWEALPLSTGAAGSGAVSKEGGEEQEQWQEQEADGCSDSRDQQRSGFGAVSPIRPGNIQAGDPFGTAS